MQFLRNLKQLDDVWKKAIICCLLVLIGLPLFWLVKHNLSSAIKSSSAGSFIESLKLDKLLQAKDSALSQMSQQANELGQAVKELQEEASKQTTSSPANSEISTTTTTND